MLKQAQVDHYRFQHQLTEKMSCGWKHETFGAGVSARTSSDQNTTTERAARSTSDSEMCRLLSVSLSQDTIHQQTGRESSQDQSNCPERGLGDHGACSSWVSQSQQGHSSLSHLTRRQRDNRVLQAKRLQAWKVEPNWQETGGSGSATARQGGTICQPGQMSNNQVERQQGSQGRGSYQMKSQERLQGSTVQLEELKWKWRMPKLVESPFFRGTFYINFCLDVKEEVSWGRCFQN